MAVPRGTFGHSGSPARPPPQPAAVVSERLAAYADLVRRWSGRVQLMAAGDLERLESRHIADCLRAAPLARLLPAGPAVDVGSGAGLPGVVLAVAEPERAWRLLEPNRRRAGFLEEAVRALELNAEVLNLSAQEAARRPGLAGDHVLATARALAPPATAFALLRPLLAGGGVGLVFSGARARIPAEAEVWAEGIAIIRREPVHRMEERGKPGGGH
jgi:16S rRNA (guanine527-N7)-methyltransferase